MAVDLHSHSTASDGSYTPSELAHAFALSEVRIAALTDHDSAGGVPEFLQTCEEVGIVGIGGIEFSTIYRDREVHLLGYGLPLDNPRCAGFLNDHASRMKDRLARTLNLLASFGFDAPIEEVYIASKGNPPMPPHVLRVLADHGYFYDLAGALNFFNEYLTFGAKAWVDHKTPLEKPLNMLIEVGAVPIVSHPIRLPDLVWLEEILDMGARGFELYYPGQTGKLFTDLESIAKKRGCLATGGCDYHGAFTQRTIREVDVPLEAGIKLLEAIGRDFPSELLSGEANI
jgi:3',5'-nucleoside bisphosphate phosphatase